MGQGHAIFSSGMSPFYHRFADYFRSYLELVPNGIARGRMISRSVLIEYGANSSNTEYSRADHDLILMINPLVVILKKLINPPNLAIDNGVQENTGAIWVRYEGRRAGSNSQMSHVYLQRMKFYRTFFPARLRSMPAEWRVFWRRLRLLRLSLHDDPIPRTTRLANYQRALNRGYDAIELGGFSNHRIGVVLRSKALEWGAWLFHGTVLVILRRLFL